MSTKKRDVADGITRRSALKGLAVTIAGVGVLRANVWAGGVDEADSDVYQDILKPSLLYAKEHGWRTRRVFKEQLTRVPNAYAGIEPYSIYKVRVDGRFCYLSDDMHSLPANSFKGNNGMLNDLEFVECVLKSNPPDAGHPFVKMLTYCIEIQKCGSSIYYEDGHVEKQRNGITHVMI